MKIKTSKLDGDVFIFLVLIPIVTGIVWYKYSYNAAISMLIFFGGMYCYFNWLLNITLSLKSKSLKDFKIKIMLYTFFSIAIFAVSYILYGLSFALKDLLVG
jgi:hypothetical protein